VDGDAGSPGSTLDEGVQVHPTSSTRARGTDGVFVPNAAHFMYRSPVDQAGQPDWYFYFDTVFPEKGLHPYNAAARAMADDPNITASSLIQSLPLSEFGRITGRHVSESSFFGTHPTEATTGLGRRV
jgi:hypothetical protein